MAAVTFVVAADQQIVEPIPAAEPKDVANLFAADGQGIGPRKPCLGAVPRNRLVEVGNGFLLDRVAIETASAPRSQQVDRAVNLKRLLPERPCPTVVTCRRKEDGGKWPSSEEARLLLLREAIAEGVDYVDLEEDVAGQIPRFGRTKRIVSYHNLSETPVDLEGIYANMLKQDADVYKVSVLAQSPEDVVRVLALQQSAPKPTPFPIEYVDQGKFDPKLKGLYAPAGFQVEIVADAPQVLNPVGIHFAPDGTLFVSEWSVDPITGNRWFEFKETFRYRDGSTKLVATMRKFSTDPIKELKLNPATGIYDKAVPIISEDSMRSKRARSTFKILPRSGRIA